MLTALALAATLALGRGAAAQSDDAEGYGDGYQDGTYGRIRYADGGAAILRADGSIEDNDRSGLNAPIFPGDTVRTGSDQRVEVQLASGTLVRLDRGTALVFQSMPDPYAKFQDNAVLVLQQGALRIQARLADKEEFRIDTGSGSVYLLGDGDVRIENDGRGRTTVASLRGVAEVVGAGGSVLVRGGSRTSLIAGSDPEEPRAYSAFGSDGFDRWCEIRDAAYHGTRAEQVSQGDVPHEVQPYYNELSSYGTWTVVPDYGRVWYPTGVAAGWRPYYDGYWAYGPGGYFWVSSEPWGWAPYRYGNWQYVGTYGWCWVPGHVFAGAWVSWSWGSAYLGWAPLNYYGYPCYRYGGYRYGYYDPDCWTFVNYGNAYATNVRRYAVPVSRVGTDLTNAHVVTRAPRVPPSRLAVSADARARAIRDVAGDRAAAIRPVGNSNRRLSDIADDVLRRNPRVADRTTVRQPVRGNPRTSSDRTPQVDAAPQTRGNGRTAIQRGNPRTSSDRTPQVDAAPQTRGNGRTAIQRGIPRTSSDRTPQVDAAPQTRGNERSAIQRGNPRTSSDRAPQVDTAPQTRGNERSAFPRRLTTDPRQPQRVESQPSRGNERSASPQRLTDPRTSRGNERSASPQRLTDPRANRGNGQPQRVEPARPQQDDSRAGVRELYERMSKPRETRGADPGRAPARVEPSRPQAQAPRSQPQRAQPQRSQPPQRSAPAPRSQGQGGGQKAQPRGNGNKKH
jgi:hypothetical protein